MLHALAQKKCAFREVKGITRAREDLVTSCIFGPLAMLHHQEAARLWLAMTGIEIRSEVSAFSIQLWRRFSGVCAVEPDALVTITAGGVRHVHIVEVKWDAKLDDDQLIKQWRAVLPVYGSENSDLRHVLVVRHVNQLFSPQVADHRALLDGQLVEIAWSEICANLTVLSRSTIGPVSTGYLEPAAAALNRLGVLPFLGIGLPEGVPPHRLIDALKWRPESATELSPAWLTAAQLVPSTVFCWRSREP